MKMHGCAIGFEHFGHHGHGHKHHGRSHGHGHHGFGPFRLGARGFGPHHHGPHGFGHPGFARGTLGPHPFHFFGFQGCGPRGFEMRSRGPHGKHEYRGFGPCGRDEESHNFDRFVDGHGFEWRLYINGDVSATEKDRMVREEEHDNVRNEARETSDSDCEHTRRCWGKHGGHKFGMRHGRKCVMERKGKAQKGCRCGNAARVEKPTCHEAGPSTASTEQATPSAPGTTDVVQQPEDEQERPATV